MFKTDLIHHILDLLLGGVVAHGLEDGAQLLGVNRSVAILVKYHKCVSAKDKHVLILWIYIIFLSYLNNSNCSLVILILLISIFCFSTNILSVADNTTSPVFAMFIF